MKRWLKKWLPSTESLKRRRGLRWIDKWLDHHPYVLALNRRTVARGFGAGLLVTFIPLPLQIPLAALLAFLCRANLPIAVVTTLLTNPFTFVPIQYAIYKFGVFITRSHGVHDTIPTFHWGTITLVWREIFAWIQSLGEVYLIGLIIFSIFAAILGYILVDVLWRAYIWWTWRKRRKRRKS